MRCPHCKRKAPEGARYCPYCGGAIEQTDDKKTSENRQITSFFGSFGHRSAQNRPNETESETTFQNNSSSQSRPLTWNYGKGATLIISGNGDMTELFDGGGNPPWERRKGSIQNIVIENGVTSIGNGAFVWCEKLTSVTLCRALHKIFYAGTKAEWAKFADCVDSMVTVNCADGIYN